MALSQVASSPMPSAGLVARYALMSVNPKAFQIFREKRRTSRISSSICSGGADDVRVVLREAAHAQEAVQHARLLVAVHGAQLRPAQRQVAVGALLVLVDHEVERAVHRLEEVVRLVDGQRARTCSACRSPGARRSPTASDLPICGV